MRLAQLMAVISNQFSPQNGVVAVLLFGSYAEGSATTNSDVDIAVLYEHQCIPSSLELWDLKTQLSQELSSEVDLICLNRADPILGKQIYQHHLPVLINDSSQLTEYFSLMCSQYMELKEFIRPMEEQILKRKYYAG